MARAKKLSETATSAPEATPAVIRAWLVANGHAVGVRGRISKEARELFATSA